MAEQSIETVLEELQQFLADNWDPEITVAAWWERLGMAGWSAPSLPTEAYGKGLSRDGSVRVQRAIAEFGALGAPGGLGLLLAAPTIATHGNKEQIDRYIPDIVTGRRAWCQLFSEPGAGSDLAGIGTKAIKDGDEWIINGQKVWTSGGQIADMAMLIARTDPDQPKHAGITYFAFDMHQDGVEIRPLREMTGQALFNEVFVTDGRVPDDAMIGGYNNGWAVANTTLAFERAGLGAGGGSESGGAATPGTKAGDLDRRVGDFVGTRRRGSAGPEGVGGAGAAIFEAARAKGKTGDPTIRQNLAQLYILGEVAKFQTLRQKGLRGKGQDIPGFGNIAKLSMSRILRLVRDTGYSILGPEGTLHRYNHQQGFDETSNPSPLAQSIGGVALFAQGPQIYGGTDEIQHNIIGERVLGLAKEPGFDKSTPYSSLPKNA